MDRIWLVRRGPTQTGPFNVVDLRQMVADGRLLQTDLLWKEGMSLWQAAGAANGLFATGPGPAPPDSGGDSTGGLIPYKNAKALIAYYTGLFLSPFCIVGIPLGIVPLIFGVLGLTDRARKPIIKGAVHAWIGIVLGALSTMSSFVFWIFVILRGFPMR